MTSDFKFRDPTDPNDMTGRVPKQWSFGMKPVIRAKNLDVPGVGNVDVDIVPNWMKKDTGAVQRTDVRRGLADPYAGAYPGPGDYETEMIIGGPTISFPKEPKKTTIEKTYAPGPASYATYGTVGNTRGYLKNETNPRITSIPKKQME